MIVDQWCNYRWHGPRHDAPDSIHVEHVCHLERNHAERHTCSCWAVEPEGTDGSTD